MPVLVPTLLRSLRTTSQGLLPMPPVKPIGVRSSSFSHSFPSFYACYLLKSVQTPHATSTYIGSTPSPPRRIRQHNGELAQGARKTRLKRPWVMQMIVHGFPSRLAALQFEWAWQHPHKSRHMRDGNTSIFGSHAHKTLQKNILIVRTMISRPPFNTWPLHVKLFTHEAHQYWNDTMTNDVASSLPPGFTCTVELEGVDGKSGRAGSGRQGPISVTDEEFASTILAKNRAITAAGGIVECTICREPILDYAVSSLSTALCPSSNCHAVSHLKCLSQYFVDQEDRPTTMVPRGGHCKSCKLYTLWGDVIRGCYRRMLPSDVIPLLDIDTDDMFLPDNLEIQGNTPSSGRKQNSESPMKRRKSSKEKRNPILRSSSTSSHENFDWSNLVTSSECEDMPGSVKRKPGRPRKFLATFSPTIPQPSSKGNGKHKHPDSSVSTTEGENFDFAASSGLVDNVTPMHGQPRRVLAIVSRGASSSVLSPTSTPLKRKCGRPRKDMSLPSPGLTSPIESIRTHIPVDVTKKPTGVMPTNCRELSKEKGKQKEAFNPISLITSSEDENRDLNNHVASAKRENALTSIKRQRGRPRKTLAVISPPIKQSSKRKEQNFDLSNVVPRSGDMSNSVTIKPRRSPKNMALLSSGIPSQPLGGKDVPAPRTYHGQCTGLKAESDGSSSAESFDFGSIHDRDDNDENVIKNRDHRDVGPAKILSPLHRKVNPSKVGITRDLRTMHRLERAMSAISLTPSQETKHQSNGCEVIEVSD